MHRRVERKDMRIRQFRPTAQSRDVFEQLAESVQYQDANEAIHDALCARQHRLRLRGGPLKGVLATQRPFQ